MKVKCKWALALAPFVLTGCNDLLDPGQNPVGTSGDDVLFYVAKDREARTMYQDDWDATDAEGNRAPNAIYWGNYLDKKGDTINIYCPNTERGFAKYAIEPKAGNENVAGTVVRVSDIGVQWGPEGEHTFYAFYPASKASTLTKSGGQHIVRATVDYQQSPVSYKYKENSVTETSAATLNVIDGMDKYINGEYDPTGGTDKKGDVINKDVAKTIYGMPDMEAAVMVARHDVPAKEFGDSVPLQFNVLADVLDITLNGPTTPNTLGGNEKEVPANFIQIQSVSLEYVDRGSDTPMSEQPNVAPTDFKINHDHPIVGSFDLDMAKVAENPENPAAGTGNIADMISNVQGSASVILNTATNSGGKTYYPTLFIRTFSDKEGSENKDQKCLDHLRLRAFLIPGQVTADDLYKLRVHIQTNCGDYYKMLETKKTGTGENESGYVSSRIYPVKMGYFKSRSDSDFDLKQWIGQLDPKICISELSIPGAWHASNTTYQANTDLQAQYNAGIRAFEVHTVNGTEPYTDFNFKTKLTVDNVLSMPFYDHQLNQSTSTASNYTVDTSNASIEVGSWSSGNLGKVIGTNLTVTQTQEYLTYTQLPKFALRLYRTRNVTSATDNPSESFSDALVSLANMMTETGFMFFEFGYEKVSGANRTVTVPCRIVKKVRSRKKSGVTLTVSGYSANVSAATWNSAAASAGVFTESDQWTTDTEEYTASTMTIAQDNAWCIAVESCLNRLANTHNEKTGKNVLYTDEITRNTTISQVQGTCIAKVNTNIDENYANEQTMDTGGIGWSGNTPALFSRWVAESGYDPRTINLQWGRPVTPYVNDVQGELHEGLHWCYTELENVGNVKDRITAIDEMNGIAYSNYQGGNHRTFYATSLGGFSGSQTTDGCMALSQSLHPHVLSRLSDPSRQNVPLGLVFMNYVIPPAGQEETLKSEELIRAIINNNKAFLLHRADDPAPAVEDNVDSHFNNNSLSPLK